MNQEDQNGFCKGTFTHLVYKSVSQSALHFSLPMIPIETINMITRG
jgi:hypothetical protein